MQFPNQQEFISNWKSPPAQYRTQYFWFWNHQMKLPEIKRQIDQMKQVGAGGAFLHARDGRITPYMSEEWLQIVYETVKYGEQVGFLTWLYDEDGFPSGYAGGETIKTNPKDFSANFLVLEEQIECKAGESINIVLKRERSECELYGIIAVPFQEGTMGEILIDYPNSQIDLTNQVINDHLEWIALSSYDNWLVLIYNREWNLKAANLMSQSAMERFLSITHQKYYNYFQDRQDESLFGSIIPGIFTDEPAIMYCPGDKSFRRIIPYTVEMENLSRERDDQALLVGLAPIFFDLTENTPEYRMNFWHLASELYNTAYYQQILHWCEDHKIAFMGHVANEGNLFNQIRDQIDYFLNARYMSYGCCDQLGATYRAEFEKKYTLALCDNMVASRLAFSSARIFNLPRVDCECFGSSAWDLTLAQQKKLVDWLVSQGVNLFMPHSFNFSIENFRKRDHPPAFNQCGYFPYLNLINDYIARLSMIFSQPRGKGLPRIALLQGNNSVLGTMTPIKTQESQRTHDSFAYIIDILQRLHVDFDIVPEFYLQSLQLQNKFLTDDRNIYDIVLIPSVVIMDGVTLQHLWDWYNQGGTILFIDCLPSYTCKKQDQGILDLFWHELGELSAEALNLSHKTYQYLADTNPLIIHENTAKETETENITGILSFLQSPKEPIWTNALLPELQKFFEVNHHQGVRVLYWDDEHNLFSENGEIVALRLDLPEDQITSFIFFANLAKTSFPNADIHIKLPSQFVLSHLYLYQLNPLDGTIIDLSNLSWEIMNEDVLRLKRTFAPEESFLLCVTNSPFNDSEVSPVSETGNKWDFHPSITEMQPIMEITFMDWTITPLHSNILNLEHWTMDFNTVEAGERASYIKRTVTQTVSFMIETVPDNLIVILDSLETNSPKNYDICLNGKVIPKFYPGKILDSFMWESPNVSNLLVLNENRLEIIAKSILSQDIKLLTEPIRIVGDFITKKDINSERWILTKSQFPLQSQCYDLREEGFPNYIWEIEYKTQIKLESLRTDGSYILKLPQEQELLYRIMMNDNEIGNIWFGSYEIDITDSLLENNNILKIIAVPYPTNLYESHGTPLGIPSAVEIFFQPSI